MTWFWNILGRKLRIQDSETEIFTFENETKYIDSCTIFSNKTI